MNPVAEERAWLCRAVRALSDPPAEPCWETGELADVFAPDHAPRAAAVLVPFVPRAQGHTLLFTRRTSHLRHHAGQVSFPGGGMDPDDADLLATALRETDEETGIRGDWVEPFGYLDGLHTVSGFCVTPVAAFVDPDYSPLLQVEEVDELFEVPLAFLQDPANLRCEALLWQGRERTVYACEWEGRRIWGVTAAILKNLIDRLERFR